MTVLAAEQVGGNNVTALLAHLLAHGADVNACDPDGVTPLIAATSIGSLETVRLLIDHGADINHRTRTGNTALMTAASMPIPGGMTSRGFSSVPTAIQRAQLLLAHGADIQAESQDGETALTAAVLSESTEMVSLLLAHGADVNTSHWKNSPDARLRRPALQNETPLTLTAQFLAGETSVRMARLLLAHGAHLNAADRSGNTARRLALLNRNGPLARFLQQAGAR